METEQVVVLAVLAVLVVVVLVKAVRFVPAEHVGVVERLGRHHRTAGPGLVLLAPFVDQVRVVAAGTDQDLAMPPLPAQTADGAQVTVGLRVRYRVVDPAALLYHAPDLPAQLAAQAGTGLGLLMGERTLEDMRFGQHELGSRLAKAMADAASAWGVEVRRVDVTGLSTFES